MVIYNEAVCRTTGQCFSYIPKRLDKIVLNTSSTQPKYVKKPLVCIFIYKISKCNAVKKICAKLLISEKFKIKYKVLSIKQFLKTINNSCRSLLSIKHFEQKKTRLVNTCQQQSDQWRKPESPECSLKNTCVLYYKTVFNQIPASTTACICVEWRKYIARRCENSLI